MALNGSSSFPEVPLRTTLETSEGFWSSPNISQGFICLGMALEGCVSKCNYCHILQHGGQAKAAQQVETQATQ